MHPGDDRFQVISEHTRDALLIDPTYLGIDRSADALIIQLTLNEGRTVEVKKAFYKAVEIRTAPSRVTGKRGLSWLGPGYIKAPSH
jgi:hypothetical protein